MSQPPPATASGIDSAELRAALGQVLGRGVARLEHRPFAYRTSFPIEEIDVALDDGRALRLLLKDLGRQGLVEEVRRAKPEFLHDPLREIETYRVVLSAHGPGTACCFGAVVEPGRGRYWLFLERVAGVELYQVGELDAWQQAARWLAVFHSRLAGLAPELARPARLLRQDGDFYRLWMRRARDFAGDCPGPARRGLEWLAGRYGRVVERLLALPATVIHGEFYAANVLVQPQAGALRVCPIDWEVAAVGPGLIDLAALTAGSWGEEERTALARAYHAELAARPEAAEPETFLTALDYCRLHLAVQWLGWAPDWSPPPKQRQDWLGEALRLAEKLGL